MSAQSFRITNFPDINLQDQTVLTADAASGQKDIKVLGTEGFSVDDICFIGTPGSGSGEIGVINSISGNTISFDNDLSNDHPNTEQLNQLFGDQIKAYRAANVNDYPPSDDTFAANALGSSFNIDYDGPTTLFNDNTGSNQYWYKFVFYNSITGAETNIASSVPLRGGINNYCSIEDIRREAGLINFNQIQDTQIATRRANAKDEVDAGLLAAGYTLPLKDAEENPYTPPYIANANRLLAAGYVLIQDYGPIAEGNSKDGEDKLKAGRQLLENLLSDSQGKRKAILADISGKPLNMSQRIVGWPNDTTAFSGSGIDRTAGEPPLFTMDRRF